jgi:carboxymethylenebutenolidase
MILSQPDGFLAVPPAGSGPGALVLHAWWGLNDTMKTYCAQLAEAGFVAFAPDLYHGKLADTIPDAEALGNALDADDLQAKAEIAEAVSFLHGRADTSSRGLAVIGFSLGAAYALDLAAADPERISAVIIYYGTGPAEYGKSSASYLGHFAEHDPYEPEANVAGLEAALRQAGRPVTFHRSEATGHWFCEPDRADAYDEESARLAWQRTLDFLKPREWIPMSKTELLDGLRADYLRLEALFDTLGPAGLDEPGVAGHWSMKDIVAHLTGWNRGVAARIQAAQRGEPEPPSPWPAHVQAEDDINAWIYESNRGRSVQEVLADSREVFQQLVTAIEALPEDARAETLREYGRSFRVVSVNDKRFHASEMFDHYRDDHEPDVRAWLARLERHADH